MTRPTTRLDTRSPPLPRHHQAYLLLRQRLQALGPDDLLPGENLLATELGVARMTLRRALRRLEEEGRIVRRRGEGTRLCPRGSGGATHGAMDTVAQLLRIGAATKSSILGLEDQAAAGEVAAGLRVQPGTSVRMAAVVRSLGALRVSHLAAYFPDPSKLSGLSARMLAREPLLAITERLCGPVDRVEQRIGAVLADGPLVEALGVDPGEPLMRVDRWFLGGGHVRQFSIAHYRADCFVITTAEEMTDRKSPRSARWQIEMRIADRD